MGLSNLARGAGDVASAVTFIAKRPGLWKWIAAPAVLAAVVAVVLISIGGTVHSDMTAWMAGFIPEFARAWIAPVLKVILWIVFLAAGYVAFVLATALLSAPFNEMLSEAVEFELTGVEPPPFRLHTFVRDIVLGILHAVRRVAGYGVWMGAALAVSAFIPAIGTLAGGLVGLYITARFCAYDALDARWARKGTGYEAKWTFYRTHRARCVGMGGAIAGLLAVPVVNLLALSVGAVAATRLAIDVGDPT